MKKALMCSRLWTKMRNSWSRTDGIAAVQRYMSFELILGHTDTFARSGFGMMG